MKKLNCAVAVLAAAVMVFSGCGKKTVVPTATANVPVVSETPAIQSPDLSPLVSPSATAVVTPETSPVTSPKTT